MADAFLEGGTQLLFADHATDFGAAPATAANSLIIGTPTDVQIDLTNLAISGGARQSAKSADLGALMGQEFRVEACLEFETAPADDGYVDFFWGPSPSVTAATGNPGGLTGSDTAFTATAGNLAQLQRIGRLRLRNNVINIGVVGVFRPLQRYGSMVVRNFGSTALRSTATAMDETHIVMQPWNTDIA